MPVYDVLDYGAVGDGEAYDTGAIQRAIDACAAGGGGTVLVPAGGTYLSGTIRLAGHVDLHVEGGARIVAGLCPQDYPNEQAPCLIEAFEAHNVSVTGRGTIDGRGRLFMAAEGPHIYSPAAFRPRLAWLIGCRDVTFRDVTLRDAAFWGLHLTGCQDVLIHGLRILNDLKVPNCDGIDPDHCRNVRISDCHIEAGDDAIVLKNERRHAHYGPTENVVVTGCTLVSTSSAIKIGTSSCGDFRNIVFDSCAIDRTNRGLSIQIRDEGGVEDVLFANMVVRTRLFHDAWWGQAEPIHVSALPRLPGGRVGRVRNVRFTNICCRGEGGAFIAGCADSRPEGIVLDNVRIEIDKSTGWPAGRHDRRPMLGEWPGALSDHPTAGVYCEHARDVTLRNVEVAWGPNRPESFGQALEAHDVQGLKLQGFLGQAAHPDRHAPQRID